MKRNLETIFNVVLGTAGHIDHGKSTLVRTLTGIDPDRLPEEQARGLTIDLGFAPFALPDGRRVGIIDVPGHERLIKNMVAGATGIDLVLLVIAADDGVMPQTREHLTIMEILGLQSGIVAITKVDLVDAELRELVREEVREMLLGTFLEEAPIIEVSSATGEGIDELRGVLCERLALLRPRQGGGIFRMPIQRVFSPKGFGTVVTGVPVSGTARTGDTLEVLPLGERGRVRGIQAYRDAVDLARAGHSTAINLSDVDYRAVERGMVLAAPGYFRASRMFEAKLRYLPASRRALQHQTSIRLHVGTVEAVGKVFLLEKKALDPGDEGYVQFRLDDPIVAAPGDRYVLRLHSPMETIGGGEILSPSRWRLKIGKEFVVSNLRRKEEALGDPHEYVASLIDGAGFAAVSEKELSIESGRPLDEVRGSLRALIDEGRVRPARRAGQFFSAGQLDAASRRARQAAADYYRDHPRRLLMDKTHLRQILRSNDVFLQDLIDHLAGEGELDVLDGGQLRWRDFGPRLDPSEEAMREEIRERLREAPFTPPSPEELAGEKGWDPRRMEDLFDLLAEEEAIVKVAQGIYFHREAMDEARRRLEKHLTAEGSITAADAKNLLASTRKYSIPLLEFLDRDGFTLRKGDVRVLKQA